MVFLVDEGWIRSEELHVTKVAIQVGDDLLDMPFGDVSAEVDRETVDSDAGLGGTRLELGEVYAS